MRWILCLALLAVAGVANGQALPRPRWDVTITGATGQFTPLDGRTYNVPAQLTQLGFVVNGASGPVGVAAVRYSAASAFSEVTAFVDVPGTLTSPAGVSYTRKTLGRVRVTPDLMSFSGTSTDTGNGQFTAQVVFVP